MADIAELMVNLTDLKADHFDAADGGDGWHMNAYITLTTAVDTIQEKSKRIEELEAALTTLGEKGFMSFEDRAAFARATLQENSDE